VRGCVATRERDASAREAAEAVARRSRSRLVALLSARTRDVAGAEDALGDAFAAALVDWPVRGIPGSPEAWLMTVARRRWIDACRRRRSAEDAAAHLRLLREEIEAAAAGEAPLPDERLALLFACAHPALDARIRAPLILQTVLGFDAATIASAFHVSREAMAQRLVRAKRRIRQARIQCELPARVELAPRLASVLEALYTAFALGASDARRRGRVGEALWLARLVASLLPDEPEARALLAHVLREQAPPASRRGAGRATPSGELRHVQDGSRRAPHPRQDQRALHRRDHELRPAPRLAQLHASP
jgi:RNA polymerase sigma-70 factor (ECF subfamily)